MEGEGRKRKAEEEKNKVEQEAKRHQEEKKDESEKKEEPEEKAEREKKEESEAEGSYVSCSTCSSDNNWEEDSSNDGLPGFGKEL